jgi:N-acetylglucosamine kinase-like BadF-type ATPase
MGVFVGLDCGGSSSRVLAIDEEGKVLFQGQSGAANLVSTPENRLRKNLAHATDGCPRADYVCGCFAGLISDETRHRGEEHLRQLFPSAKVRAEPDYVAAFYASPEDTDVCVIAGTGSLVCSLGPNGIVKSGGRGYILGDYGSGYHFGRDALIHYLDSPATCTENLRRAVRDLFHAEDEGTIVAAVYKSPTPAGILAKLAKALGADARDGEPYALESLERNLSLLVEVVERHVRNHVPNNGHVHISLAGGVWKAAAVLRDRFAELAAQSLPDRQVVVSRIVRPPLYGAVELAKEIGKIEH